MSIAARALKSGNAFFETTSIKLVKDTNCAGFSLVVWSASNWTAKLFIPFNIFIIPLKLLDTSSGVVAFTPWSLLEVIPMIANAGITLPNDLPKSASVFPRTAFTSLKDCSLSRDLNTLPGVKSPI